MDTVRIYLHANVGLKEKALAKTEPFRSRPGRYRPPDQLLAFLTGALIMPSPLELKKGDSSMI